MKNNFLKKLLIVFFITMTGIFANGNSAKKTKTVRVLNVDVKISIEQAKQLALNHSKVAKNTAKMTKIRLDKENRKFIYEIEFYTKQKKYKYNIDANTGKVLSYSEKERTSASTVIRDDGKIINTNGNDTEIKRTPKYIGIEKAKEIAVARITGAKKINVTNIQLDSEKGRKIYEGRIVYKNTEYKFDIDAITGEVIKWEVNEH
ncbi:PepSY domain-containing protein [Leptotrichia trevisanii]|uniref:PepSY domain-containing protein n=1 Tax=Leptotrichia trevisanii TaxID=109328 RepID=UPI0026ED2BE8|nr:PepSY domain-containing protein [Leptotrichia trevisanii]